MIGRLHLVHKASLIRVVSGQPSRASSDERETGGGAGAALGDAGDSAEKGEQAADAIGRGGEYAPCFELNPIEFPQSGCPAHHNGRDSWKRWRM